MCYPASALPHTQILSYDTEDLFDHFFCGHFFTAQCSSIYIVSQSSPLN